MGALGGWMTEGVRLLGLIAALHTMKVSPQNSFGEARTKRLVRSKPLRSAQPLKALRTLPVYPVFEDDKSY